MKIGLIGAGRLGICLALLIEQEGYHVIASDVREDYIKDRKVELLPKISEKLRTSLKLIESITQEINLLSKKKQWKGIK